MKLTIYQIEQNYNQLAEQLIDNDGELTSELSEQLAITEEQLQNKSVAYSFVIKQMDADIDTIDAEIKRLQAAKKQREKASEYLKERIKHAMELFNIEEIKTPLVKINFRKSETVEVENVNHLPDKYIVRKLTEQADKVKLKQAIKDGEIIDGVSIVEHRNLQIR
jgi:CxxC motif-containing protein